MKAALPVMNAVCVSPSVYEVTLRGVVTPMFLRNRSRTAAAFGLLIVALPLSMNWPPPEEASHSSASHVRPSYALPWNTKPEKFGFEDCSPAWIFLDIAKSCDQVVGGLE